MIAKNKNSFLCKLKSAPFGILVLMSAYIHAYSTAPLFAASLSGLECNSVCYWVTFKKYFYKSV